MGDELTAVTTCAVVHQASGVDAVQLGVPVGDALLRLRARSFTTDRLIAVVADDVVAGRLRFGVGPRRR